MKDVEKRFQNIKYFGKIYTVAAGIGKKTLRLARVVHRMSRTLEMNMNEWDIEWANSLGAGKNVRPQCEDYEYQFEVGDLVKLAPGFLEKKVKPGDLGVVTKKIVLYCNQVKTDGPGYKIAWQKEQTDSTDIREFKLVPAKTKR